MPKRQHANDAEHADATVITLVVFIFILVFFKFVILLIEQQFLERIEQSVKRLVIEPIQRIERWPIHANGRWFPLPIGEFGGRGIGSR